VSKKGIYDTARSTTTFGAVDTFSGTSTIQVPDTSSRKSEAKAQAALNELMTKLSSDGWQQVGKNARWWEYKYRRQKRG
jgi:hypothetical protein